ncbi:hypothetical protein DEO72_LG11g1555 [Vigna unguiculata]|uniref:Uncharacterized protein n=1 Tax=Vigna unguiculata TaxID=3917 RepID=A0A4D6NNG3_VIGUN|nr:hypothetical protein DEO72_LG11g1555 [Vigna unguiculata]
MEQNNCKNARLRRKLVLQQRFNARSNQHSYKATVSQRSFQKNIDSNPLQQLDINVDNNNNNLQNMNSIFHKQIGQF